MPSMSVSPVVMLWYGKRHPEGVVRLSSSILTTEASATTARPTLLAAESRPGG